MSDGHNEIQWEQRTVGRTTGFNVNGKKQKNYGQGLDKKNVGTTQGAPHPFTKEGHPHRNPFI